MFWPEIGSDWDNCDVSTANAGSEYIIGGVNGILFNDVVLYIEYGIDGFDDKPVFISADTGAIPITSEYSE